MSSRPERDEWNQELIAGLRNAVGPTSAAAGADGATKRAVSGTVAITNPKESPLGATSTGEGCTLPCMQPKDSRCCAGFAVLARSDVAA